MRDVMEGTGKSATSRGGHAVGGLLGFWLGRAEVGAEQSLGELRISPIIQRHVPGEPFALLHEALAAGAFKVTEQGSGTVNEVIAHNIGDRPVLVLEGESIVGARQNRVVVMDVLVPPGKSAPVPVGCVERGRWHWTSREFDAASLPVEPELRQRTRSDVAFHGVMSQARLWQDVDAKLASQRVASPTSDYQELVVRRMRDAEASARAITTVPGQVGLIALHDGALVGFDVVGHPDNWASLASRLVPAYALSDRVGGGPRGDRSRAPHGIAPRSAEQWLREIAAAEVQLRPSPGMGEQLVLVGEHVTGGGLWFGDRPAHVAVFERQAEYGSRNEWRQP
jgi:hypothetical protein